jgi:hypothetical protein
MRVILMPMNRTIREIEQETEFLEQISKIKGLIIRFKILIAVSIGLISYLSFLFSIQKNIIVTCAIVVCILAALGCLIGSINCYGGLQRLYGAAKTMKALQESKIEQNYLEL